MEDIDSLEDIPWTQSDQVRFVQMLLYVTVFHHVMLIPVMF